jgi:hypothetical protein
MDKVTQSNAATAQEAANAAGELSHQAGNLMTVVQNMNELAHGAQGRPAGGRARLAAPAPAHGKSDPGRAPEGAAPQKALPMDDFDF